MSAKVAPDPLELTYPEMKTGGMGRDRGAVDGARRGAADDLKGHAVVTGIELYYRLEYPDLVSGARTAAP